MYSIAGIGRPDWYPERYFDFHPAFPHHHGYNPYHYNGLYDSPYYGHRRFGPEAKEGGDSGEDPEPPQVVIIKKIIPATTTASP